MSFHSPTRKTTGRPRGGWLCALAAVMYLLLPGVFAAHVAVAHPGEQASAWSVATGSPDDSDHGHHHGEPERDGPSCDLCHLIGTLGHSGQAPAPAMSVLIDVTSPEYALTPQTFCLPADSRQKPASPRAPPRL